MFFLLFLLDNRRIRIRIREAQKHMDPTDPDPDPQHCLQEPQVVLQVDGLKFTEPTTTNATCYSKSLVYNLTKSETNSRRKANFDEVFADQIYVAG